MNPISGPSGVIKTVTDNVIFNINQDTRPRPEMSTTNSKG